MKQQGRWQRRLGIVLPAALCLVCGQGCLSFVHSLDLPPKEQVVVGEKIPAPSRNHVHIFLIHGLDPLDLANLNGLTEYIQKLGYIKTHYGQMYHFWSFRNEMRRLHKEEPKTRFVVIGFSLGADVACELAKAVKKDDLVIDLLIYMGGFTLDNSPQSQPENVARVINILTACCPWEGDLSHADNIKYGDVWHFGPPTHRQTRELLAHELAVVAARVPYVEKVPPLPPELEEEIPRPRRLPPDQLRQMSSQLPPEWSFLNSRSATAEPPPPPLAKPSEEYKAKRLPFSIMP